MATCGSERLIFIHVPKTGGTWVNKAMKTAGLRLAPEGHSKHPFFYELDRRNRFAFGFVREPQDWWGSEWRFRRHQGYRDYTHHPYDRWLDLRFDEFMEQVIEHCPGWLSRLYDKHLGAVEDSVDFVGRYEHLEDDLVRALRLAGEEFDEGVVRGLRSTNESGGSTWLLPEVLQALMESEQSAYQRFYPELLP
jgi:sulfotransferase famil protein